MGMKGFIKKLVFNITSGTADMLYRRPYNDPEAKIRSKSENEILHLDLVITECCSLKCRDCSNLMQYYKTPENISSNEVIADLNKLLDCMRVRELKVIGGEPFVNQGTLSAVLDHLSGEAGNNVDTINIITNGTIIPNDACYEAMSRNPKVMVSFSNYGNLSSRQKELMDSLKQRGIHYSIIDDSFYWLDFGRPIEYNESDDFVSRQFKYCYNRKNCNTLYRGGLYMCPRQAHGIRLGFVPCSEDEYVNLFNPLYTNSDELRRDILKLIRRTEQISTCRYCINGKYIHIPRAVQMDK